MANLRLIVSMYRVGPTAPVGSGGVTLVSVSPCHDWRIWGTTAAPSERLVPAEFVDARSGAAAFARSYAAWSGTRYPWERRRFGRALGCAIRWIGPPFSDTSFAAGRSRRGRAIALVEEAAGTIEPSTSSPTVTDSATGCFIVFLLETRSRSSRRQGQAGHSRTSQFRQKATRAATQ